MNQVVEYTVLFFVLFFVFLVILITPIIFFEDEQETVVPCYDSQDNEIIGLTCINEQTDKAKAYFQALFLALILSLFAVTSIKVTGG